MEAWEDIEDPDGRLRKGMLAKWKHNGGDRPDMEILRLCAPSGLYRRPVVPGEQFEALAVNGRFPCAADVPGAVYEPEALMVYFRYLHDGGETTGRAIDIEQVEVEPFVAFGPIAREQIGMQCQYASRYILGKDRAGVKIPALGTDLRFRNWPNTGMDYHGIEIHRGDVAEFVSRVKQALP